MSVQTPRRLDVHRTEIDGEDAFHLSVPDTTTTEWLDSTVAVTLEDWR
jgi:hypothetical protein